MKRRMMMRMRRMRKRMRRMRKRKRMRKRMRRENQSAYERPFLFFPYEIQIEIYYL
jgi:hypothetical protein